jgi:hypothetical protein
MSEDYDVFLSHSFKDRYWVSVLVKALSQRNLRVWSGYEWIQAGDSWEEAILAIDEGIRKSKSFVTIITPESVSSSFMAAELGSALALKKPIIPIVSSDTPSEKLPGPVRLRRYISMDEPEIVAEEISRRLITKPQNCGLSKDEGSLCVTN